jgi:hypothetical protein
MTRRFEWLSRKVQGFPAMSPQGTGNRFKLIHLKLRPWMPIRLPILRSEASLSIN